MYLRVLTLRYDESLGGFPEEPLRQALAGGNLLETREFFFSHGGVPHLTLVLVLDAVTKRPTANAQSGSTREDASKSLPEHLQPLYAALRTWRNERAKQMNAPSYVIMRNIQLAEICRRAPHTLAALKEIEGVGEGTVAKYGQEILGLIPKDLQPEAAEKPANPEVPRNSAPAQDPQP